MFLSAGWWWSYKNMVYIITGLSKRFGTSFWYKSWTSGGSSLQDVL